MCSGIWLSVSVVAVSAFLFKTASTDPGMGGMSKSLNNNADIFLQRYFEEQQEARPAFGNLIKSFVYSFDLRTSFKRWVALNILQNIFALEEL